MAKRQKKGLKGSIDDVLSDLLGVDDDIPLKSSKPASYGDNGGRLRGIASQGNKKSLLDDDFFSKMAHQKDTEAEDPDISDVDPEALLETLKDMDDMEADLLGIKKKNSGRIQKPVKDTEKSQPLTELARSAKKTVIDERGDSVSRMDKKPSSVPAASKPLKQKLSFEDMNDPLAGLLSDEEQDMAKKVYSSATNSAPETNAGTAKEKEASLPAAPGLAVAAERKREELIFEEDGNDLMDVLGFGDSLKAEQKAGRKGEEGEPRPARSMLDELLGRGTAAKLLERPSTGEAKEFKLDKKYKKQADKEDPWGDEFTFGSYQPTVASAPEGRQSRRQSVRFSSENLSDLKADQRSKPSTPVSSSPVRSKAGADWLGLKDEDFDSPPPSPPKELSKASIRGPAPDISCSPSDEEHPLPTRSKPAVEGGAQKPEPLTDNSDSWLNNVLSKKKSQAQEKVEEKRAEPPGPVRYGEEVAPVPLSSSPPATFTQKQQQSDVPVDRVATLKESRPSMTLRNAQEQATSVVSSGSRKGIPLRDTIKAAPTAYLQGAQDGLQIPAVPQLLHSEPPARSSLTTSDSEKKMANVQAQLRESVASYQAELLSAQTHLAELEGQVRRLELEKNQQKLLLESLQQRYRDDLELIENAHRNRIKVIEDSYRQREEHFRQENQELAQQYLSHCQSTEQAKSELLAQHQRRLTEMEQEKVKEIDRLRELQRMSIQQMHKDHEEQLQRLKHLKDQEIDAVTSATSYTRSLNGIIEQMEQFSSNLNALSNKVEATHHTTSQGLEMGARQREEQHRVLQDRLAHQQRDMEEERGRLQEVISKMEARLNEQTRLLEQERWRVTAEQSKVASLQRSLEEQRRVMTQQLAIEREELERAKNALLEEQKSVMQKCAEERHKLAMEWSEFHTQQRLSKERAEREVDRALHIDSRREGAIMSLAKEQADLKIKASELRAMEEQLVREREILEQEKQQLRLEKERVNAAALNIRQRADEIDSMSKLSSQRYEEGERALLEARKVESEHQARLRTVQQQTERLKQQEEYLHQERLNLSHQRRQLEQLRDGLPSNSLLFQPTPPMPSSRAQANIISSMQYLPVAAADLPKVDLGISGASQDLPRIGPADVYAKLVLHKLTADRDNDFLEEEQFFLETLKKASYKTSSQIA